MEYGPDGSGAYDYLISPELTSVFHYSNASYAYNNENDISSYVPAIVNADLDAGFPVIFGIYSTSQSAGHEVIGDGYGYNSSTLYYHLNLGWSGEDNAWYNLPNIGTDYAFNVVDSITYNIYPSGKGEVISGRVLDSSGNPISGVSVTAVGGSATYPAVTTNAYGIYAVAKVASATSYTITASKAGYQTASISKTTGTSPASVNYPTLSTTSGNVWGANFTLSAGTTYTVTPSAGANGSISPNTAQTVAGGSSLTFTATPNANYTVDSWSVDGSVVQTGGTTYTLVDITANHTVNVTFSPLTVTYIVTPSAAPTAPSARARRSRSPPAAASLSPRHRAPATR